MEAWSNLEVFLCERATLERVKIIQSFQMVQFNDITIALSEIHEIT